MVEFSGYARSDVNHFRSCFPGITGTYSPDAIVGPSTSDTSGKSEVALDLEVAMAAAPDADLRAYIAPNDPSFAPADPRPDAPGRRQHHQRQLGRLRAADLTAGCSPPRTPRSSWRRSPASRPTSPPATSASTDCYPFTGSANLLVDDPVVTAVCDRRRRHGARGAAGVPEAAARRPGTDRAAASRCGGRSPPTRSARRSRSPGASAAAARRGCRETPDISLDARPKRTRLHHLLQPLRGRPGHRLGADRRHERGGAAHGGADRRRRRGGGQAARLRKPVPVRPGRDERLPRHRLGHEQPLRRPPLHRAARATTWRRGSARSGRGRSPPRSPHTRPAAVSVDATALHVAGPVNGRRIAYGRRVTFRGHADRHDHLPADRKRARCSWSPTSGTFRVRTNAAGAWSVTRSKAILRDLSWHAVYARLRHDGARVLADAQAVRDAAPRPHASGSRSGTATTWPRPGAAFTVIGRSLPVMAGAEVVLQERRDRGPWTNLGASPVGGGGRYDAERAHARARPQPGAAVGVPRRARSSAGSRPTRAPAPWWTA